MAILAIAVFGFIALLQAVNTARAIKRSSARPSGRFRRPVAGDAAALELARSLVREAAGRHGAEAVEAGETGDIPAKLEAALEECRAHYRERVEHRHRILFNRAVDEIILRRDR